MPARPEPTSRNLKVTKTTYKQLAKLKITTRDSFEEVIRRLLALQKANTPKGEGARKQFKASQSQRK